MSSSDNSDSGNKRDPISNGDLFRKKNEEKKKEKSDEKIDESDKNAMKFLNQNFQFFEKNPQLFHHFGFS